MIDEKIHSATEEEVVLEEEKQVAEPPHYKVVLHNDDYTPMDFVVLILQKYFSLDETEAIRIMLLVHNTGIGIAGIFPREIAETKVHKVNAYARKNRYPLKCTMEKD